MKHKTTIQGIIFTEDNIHADGEISAWPTSVYRKSDGVPGHLYELTGQYKRVTLIERRFTREEAYRKLKADVWFFLRKVSNREFEARVDAMQKELYVYCGPADDDFHPEEWGEN